MLSPLMGNPVKIAILGGGYGTKVALPVYLELAELEPIAVWSRRPERARELAEASGLPLGTSDIDELLGAPGLEAVHVATPVSMHAEVAIAAARRGLHVLCEKPLATDLAEARRVVSAVEQAGVVAAVNYGRRFQVARERLIERIREVAGRPRMVSVSLVFSDHAEAGSRPWGGVTPPVFPMRRVARSSRSSYTASSRRTDESSVSSAVSPAATTSPASSTT